MATITRQGTELLTRWDDALPTGSTLRVDPGDTAVLVYGGAELAVLGAGQVVLSAEALPALAPAIEGNDVEAELWFVRGTAVEQKFGTQVQVTDASSGLTALVRLFGTCRMKVEGPDRAVLACADNGPEALGELVQAAFQQAAQAALGQAPLLALVSGLSPDGLAQLADAVSQRLASAGVRVVSIDEVNAQLDEATQAKLRQVGGSGAKAAPSASGGLKCSKCGTQVASGKFCPNCGGALSAAPAGCKNCGQPLPAGARFCGSCGTPQ